MSDARGLITALVLALTGCAAPAPKLDATIALGPIELPVQGFHQRCITLAATDRLDYDYLADPPLTFVIEYRTGQTAVQFLRRENSPGDLGRFNPVETHEYCLRWENTSAFPALLRYRIAPAP